MPLVTAFLQQIQNAFINVTITADSRGVCPGGAISLDLSRGHTPFASLLIRSLHPTHQQFANRESYVITDISIDNAEVIKLRRPTDAKSLWLQVERLIQDRHHNAINAMRTLPVRSPSKGHPRHFHSRRYKQRNRHATSLARIRSYR